jgi:hypothetical protein
MIRIKICCISSKEEAQIAISFGASAIGLLKKMPSGKKLKEMPIPVPLMKDHRVNNYFFLKKIFRQFSFSASSVSISSNIFK